MSKTLEGDKVTIAFITQSALEKDKPNVTLQGNKYTSIKNYCMDALANLKLCP